MSNLLITNLEQQRYTVMSDEEFEKLNETARKMQHLEVRAKAQIKLGMPKLLMALGPQGLGKSLAFNKGQKEYVDQGEAIWRQQEPWDRSPRRTGKSDGVNIVYRSPVVKLGGHSTALDVYANMFRYYDHDEFVSIDDLTLTAPIMRILHEASEAPFEVHWGRATDIKIRDDETGVIELFPHRFNFWGRITLTANKREHELPKALRDRAQIINFPYNRDDRFLYVDRMSFVKGGMLKYLMPPPPHGLGQVLTIEEALNLLAYVRNFMWEPQIRRQIREPSFRLVQKLIFDRVLCGEGERFREMALDHINAPDLDS